MPAALALGAGLYTRAEQTLPTASQPTNKSYRLEETYIKVKGEDNYLYRALDSTGQTIDFLLTAKRDTAAAKRFLRRAIEASGNPMPRVMNVDKNPAYPAAVEALKADGIIPRRVALRQCKYLNSVIEQDHRTVKKRVWLAKGCGSFQSAWRTLEGIEAVNMIRKGRVRWLANGNVVGQAHSLVNCSDFLPNPDSPLTDLYWPDHLHPQLRNETTISSRKAGSPQLNDAADNKAKTHPVFHLASSGCDAGGRRRC